MAKRTKKAPVRPEQRRDWLRRSEEDGESPPQIATKDGYDIRTVRSQIELAKEERESREARTLVRHTALEKHYDDLIRIADSLNSRLSGTEGVSPCQDDVFLEAALREHLPRSPIWSYLAKIKVLRQEANEKHAKLDKAIEGTVKAYPKLIPLTDAGLKGVMPGVTAVLIAEAKQWSQGNTLHTLKDNLVIEPAVEGLVNPRFGFAHLGVMEESLASMHMPTVHDAIAELEGTIRDCKEYRDLEDTLAEINRLGGKLREELAVIRLRRIVPGRCRYCPL